MPLLPVDRSHDGHSSPVMLSECRPTIGAGSTPTPRHTNPSGVLLHEPTQAFLLNEASSRIRVSGANASSAIVSPGWRNAPGEDDPPSFPPEVAIEVKAIACELPSRLGLPLSRLFVPDIRAEVLARGLVAEISGTTIWRWLATDAIRPWSHRSWIFPRAPDFEPKAARVLDLYAREWEGELLGADEYVVSADEKTSIQCRCRCHPTLPPAAARAMLVEHEYERGGALCYFAAWDVHQAKLFGCCEPTTGIAPFGRLVEQVMCQEPYG